MTPLLTIPQLAEAAQVSQTTVHLWAKDPDPRRRLRLVDMGTGKRRMWRCKPEEWERVLRERGR